MEALNLRLRELEQVESKITTAWDEVTNKRKEQDLELSRQREAEDVEWKERLEERDREEDALRQEKRNLSRGAMTPFTSKLAVNFAQTPPAEATRGGTAPADNSKRAPKDRETDKRFGPRSPADNRYVHSSSLCPKGQLLFTRPSDGALVSLKCCIGNCEKSSFRTVYGLRVHITRAHGVKDLFENMAQAIEKCGILVVEKKDVPNGEDESGTLNRPFEVDSDLEFQSVQAEWGDGVKSSKHGISRSEVEDRNTDLETHKFLGRRVKPYKSRGAAVGAKDLPEAEYFVTDVRHHMKLSRSPKSSKKASRVRDSSSALEPLMKHVRRAKNVSKVS
ncbi:hypothetical protein MMC11_004107 [Xylographa trunciseda]|nr:hypothetical protein [Xylographa trunciseda]